MTIKIKSSTKETDLTSQDLSDLMDCMGSRIISNGHQIVSNKSLEEDSRTRLKEETIRLQELRIKLLTI